MSRTIAISSSSGTHEMSLDALHLKDRRIFLTGAINMEIANDVIMQLLWLQEESDDPIQIYINSPGGSVYAGLAIYDVLQTMEVDVDIYCVGMAMSMGSLLLAAGQPGHRYIYPHARVMVHAPYITGGVGGNADSIQNTANEMLNTQQTFVSIMAHHTGRTPEEIERAASYDHYMSAEEAVAFGICDQVYGGDEIA